MKLTAFERILLITILPVEGDFRTMKTIAKLKDGLFFNEEEVKKFNMVTENGMTKWGSRVPTETDVPIGELASEVIVTALQAKDASKTLTSDYLGLWERFIDSPEV
jgi:hypothetical protein